MKDMNYWTTTECSEMWNITRRRVQIYCEQGRIEGAYQIGRMWFIPVGTEKPIDPRTERKMERIKKLYEDYYGDKK